jgi:phosphoglucosamine mutase
VRKLFGTDGIRGKANTYPMTGDLAFKLGQATARVFGNGRRPKVIIGKDTRRSGYIFEYALTAGLCSMGADAYLIGPMPTPAVGHLVRSFAADVGIVITASHNPADDNGIKFFDQEGYKLPDKFEEEIENHVLSDRLGAEPIDIKDVGMAHRIDDAAGRYIEFAKGSVGNLSLDGVKIVLDCAHGAAYKVAPLIYRELGADVVVYGNKPDGLNINEDAGSLNPEILSAEVLGQEADIGIALDGDADRVIMVDERGEIVDGDEMLAIIAAEMKKEGRLAKNTIVPTQYSNLGLDKYLASIGISTSRVLNGDRYVIEEMRSQGYALGGECSGHIIIGDVNTTGDGVVAGLQILKIMKESGKKLSELKKVMSKFPQTLLNIKVKEKPELEAIKPVMAAVKKVKKELGSDGRVLLRYSGTEPKCRVMVEGPDQKSIERHAKAIADAIREEIGA